MAIQVLLHRTCDRCQRVYEECKLLTGETVPGEKSLPLELLRGDTSIFRFADLCNSCERAVENLVSRLKLSDKKKEKEEEKVEEKEEEKVEEKEEEKVKEKEEEKVEEEKVEEKVEDINNRGDSLDF
jgi:hypothetical protein